MGSDLRKRRVDLGFPARSLRFAPSSRSTDARRPDEAPGEPQGEPRRDGERKAARPEGNRRRRSRKAEAVAPTEEARKGGGGRGARRGRTAARRNPPRQAAGAPQGEPPLGRSGRAAQVAEVAWSTRARGADGGWELRFPASLRSLGFFSAWGRAPRRRSSPSLRGAPRAVPSCHDRGSEQADAGRRGEARADHRSGDAPVRRARLPGRARRGHRGRGGGRQRHRLPRFRLEGGALPRRVPARRLDAPGLARRAGGRRRGRVLGHARLVARAHRAVQRRRLGTEPRRHDRALRHRHGRPAPHRSIHAERGSLRHAGVRRVRGPAGRGPPRRRRRDDRVDARLGGRAVPGRAQRGRPRSGVDPSTPRAPRDADQGVRRDPPRRHRGSGDEA